MKLMIKILSTIIALTSLFSSEGFAQDRDTDPTSLFQIDTTVIEIGTDRLQIPFDGQLQKKRVEPSNTYRSTVGFFAANGSLDKEDAREEGEFVAESVCIALGGTLYDFEITQPHIMGTRILKEEPPRQLFYKVFDEETEQFTTVLLDLDTRRVYNGVLDSILTSMIAYNKKVIEKHAVTHWELKSVTCGANR